MADLELTEVKKAFLRSTRMGKDAELEGSLLFNGTDWSSLTSGKLYGRSKEQEQILRVYDRIRDPSSPRKSELILIEGKEGTGKTSLARTLQAQVEQDGGFFLFGKFDQEQRREPHVAFSTAFSTFALDVISRGGDCVQSIRKAVNKAVRGEGSVLTKMIPELEKVIGKMLLFL